MVDCVALIGVSVPKFLDESGAFNEEVPRKTGARGLRVLHLEVFPSGFLSSISPFVRVLRRIRRSSRSSFLHLSIASRQVRNVSFAVEIDRGVRGSLQKTTAGSNVTDLMDLDGGKPAVSGDLLREREDRILDSKSRLSVCNLLISLSFDSCCSKFGKRVTIFEPGLCFAVRVFAKFANGNRLLDLTDLRVGFGLC